MKRSIAFLVFLLATLSACSMSLTVGDPPGRLTLLHLNDTYRIDAVEDGQRGGFGRVVTLIHELQEEGRDVHILHGGDFLYPSLESQLWDGEQMIEALNFMHDLAPMYVVPGNHEFDPRNADALIDAVRQSRFAWLGDNFSFETGDAAVDARLQNAYITEMDGLRIGFLALTLHAEDGGNLRAYAPVNRAYVGEARRVLRQLEAEGVDLIIGLTHLNLDEDREVAALRAQFPSFKLITGGHEHEPEFEEGSAERATIIKGASNARAIWRLDIWRDEQGEVQVRNTKVAIDSAIEPDPDYAVIERKWREQLLARIPFLEATLGVAAVPLDGRETAVRSGDSNWGVFIADQMRGAFPDAPAELAFVNGGTLRIDDYIADEISFEDVGRTFGFSSFLRRMTMKGADFRRLLEAGFRGAGPSKGYFPQISGFRVCVDRSRADGDRIVSMQVPVANDWQEIEPEKEYSLVAPDYLYGGGDGYDFSAASNVSLAGSELKYLVVDGIVNAQAEGRKVGSKTDAENLRIVILGGSRTSCW